ncbi:MAG TPA: ornithine cyclodeaminase family protein [Vicinamibacterales bacterium]|nr:ornithine cyclodeaminase family protein [Vicinamibacterales bacterium]
MAQHFRLLNEQQVHALLPMADLIAAMESALAKFSARDVLQPVRTVLTVGPTKAYFGVMPAYVPAPASLGAKLVTVFGENHQKNLPSHLATILLLDPDTGALQAIIDGRYITEARTAAVSAVSARFLANADASTLAIIGSGVQARSHLEALQHVRQLREVRIWSPRQRSREQFVDDMSSRVPVPIIAASSAEAAVRGADLIVLVTSSPTPVIEDAWVAEGAHVVCVGACRPTQQEMPPALVRRARVYVDSTAAAVVESGDIVMNIAAGLFDASHIRGEIGELVLGRVKGRMAPKDITVFKSLGMAVEDLVAADLVFRRAVEAGAGTELSV